MFETSHARLLSCLALGLAPLLGSCDVATPTPAAEQGASALASYTQEPAATLSPSKTVDESSKTCGPAGVTAPPVDACPTTRLVGYFPNSESCPSPSAGWTVQRLFVGSSTQIGNYCRYIWTGNGTPSLLPKSIATNAKPDCRVFPQSPIDGAMTPAYEQAFAQGVQPIGGSALLPGGSPVKIAVVDTAPPGTRDGQSKHGPTVAAIAGKLASGCVQGLGEPDCQRRVVTELGLPQTRTGPDESKGGYFGYQSELAEGIVDVLDHWPDQGLPDQHLVLNLAVGWEPKADDYSNPFPAVRAIRDALSVAHCRGALIIAASGNRPSGTCVAQPTGPGAWASEAGLTVAQCQALGLALPDIHLPNPLHAYHPFLHAATPVDWGQGNLADFRTGSNAKLAALGFAGFDTVGNGSYGPMSGSSISTAVISGIAGLVWSYFPTLGADAIVQLLHDSGRGTGRNAELALPQQNQLSGPAQKQIGACSALRRACDNWQSYASQQPAVCSNANVVACSTTGPGAVNSSAWDSSFDQAFAALSPGQVGNANGPTWTTLACSGCNGSPRTVELPPELATEPNMHAWVIPQPQKAPCPICKIKTDKIYLSTDASYDSFALQNMSVTLTDATGATEVLYYSATSLPPLSSTTMQVVTDAQLLTVGSGGLRPSSAHVTMVFSDNGTIITAGNQIPVY